MKIFFTGLFVIASLSFCKVNEPDKIKWPEKIQVILDNTKPLIYANGNRLPLYLWPAIDPGDLSEEDAESLVKEMDKRGVGLISSWKTRDSDTAIKKNLVLARAQKKSGQMVNIEATDLMNSFFNGDERTAHIDQNGKPFFDDSFGNHKMGCPFAIDFRRKEIRDRFELYIDRYKKAGVPVDFIFADWEIDGPLEVNRAYEASKRCTRCREYLGDDFTFQVFRKSMREMRSYLQNYTYSSPVLSAFPGALVGNYAVYPHDGLRYWYDYFEYCTEVQPFKADQKAKYREWYDDFPLTRYTYAMPVVYTWDQIFNWYDYENTDYRWFYNMLLVASNAGKSTPPGIPVISFVHWHTIKVSGKDDPEIKQMSRESYQELLWHMLLRGTDTFFMWSGKKEFPEEVALVHEVYAAAQQYGKFLDSGIPMNFDVPAEAGTVISGLMAGDSVLLRRTDFGSNHEPVRILAGTKPILVNPDPGKCQIISLN